MKKSTKKSLDELAIEMPIICELKQREFVGGQNRDSLMYRHAQPVSADGSGGNYGGGGGGGSRGWPWSSGAQNPYGNSHFWNPGANESIMYNGAYDVAFWNTVNGKNYLSHGLGLVYTIILDGGNQDIADAARGNKAGRRGGNAYNDSTKVANQRQY